MSVTLPVGRIGRLDDLRSTESPSRRAVSDKPEDSFCLGLNVAIGSTISRNVRPTENGLSSDLAEGFRNALRFAPV